MHPLDHLPAPKRLYGQLAMWCIALLLITSVNVQAGVYSGGEGFGTEYTSLDLDQISSNILTDDEGFISKPVPLLGESVYDQNRIEMVQYEVQSGDSLSVIAARYGISVNSIRYANPSLGSSDRLRTGQELSIPPDDGLYITLESGDSLLRLVEEYSGNLEQTKLFNNVSDDSELVAGTDFFIVDGEPVRPVIASAPPNPNNTYVPPTPGTPDVPQVSIAPNAEGWIRPTTGIITQGYHSGHLAYDVADRSRPEIFAAASGTVIKAAYGWNGGYGNMIMIDHGNGYQTLYAHNETLYVNVGDYVNQGQAISKMGNTGRVYGATGIHLHIEISYNGVKQSPSIMGVW